MCNFYRLSILGLIVHLFFSGLQCSIIRNVHRCIEHANRTYIIHEALDEVNWYYALENCNIFGSELATIK